MIIGHYATALIPYQKYPQAPLWLFLLAAIFLDVVWLALALVGIEAPQPDTLLDATLMHLHVDMLWSHDLLPVLGWTAVMAAIGLIVARSLPIAIWCGALVLVHEASDLLGGFKHHVQGAESPAVGLGLYSTLPELALFFEALLGVACVAWFVRARQKQGRPVSTQGARILYSIFIGGAAMQLAFTRTSLGSLLGLVQAG